LVQLSGVAASSQTFANGINGAGQIVGTLAVGLVPEPCGLVLRLAGAVGLLATGHGGEPGPAPGAESDATVNVHPS
jgi:hypothetical protein